jgi:putative peptidoglycan lipid II flippase
VIRKINLVTSFFTVSGWTLISRIMGFIRDILIAAFFGSGPVAEAFQVAYALPNMFRRLFAEGAFNMAFVPMFAKRLEAGQDAAGFARDAMSALASLLIVLTLLAQVFMPWMVLAMASGFAGDARFDLAVSFGRIAFPYILFISLAALLSGVLNAMGRFAAAAAAPVCLNIILSGAMLFANSAGLDVSRALVWAIPFAGIVQLILVWWAADRAGMRLVPRMPKFTPELKRLTIIAVPAALAGGVVQINLLVGRQVASFFDGSIQWLAVADRLYQLPLGVVGIAIGVVLLPDLSRKLRADDVSGGKSTFNRAVEFTLALSLPAAAALIVIPGALVSVLFERGAFTAADSAATAAALTIYGLGLPAFVLQKVFQPLYFARENTKTPFYFALVSMLVNAVLAIGLSFWFGYLAAALGTTVSAWALLALLWVGTRRMGKAAEVDARLLRVVPRLFAASLVMGGIVYAASLWLTPALHTPGLRYAALAGLVLSGTLSYGACAVLFGAFTPGSLKAMIRR